MCTARNTFQSFALSIRTHFLGTLLTGQFLQGICKEKLWLTKTLHTTESFRLWILSERGRSRGKSIMKMLIVFPLLPDQNFPLISSFMDYHLRISCIIKTMLYICCYFTCSSKTAEKVNPALRSFTFQYIKHMWMEGPACVTALLYSLYRCAYRFSSTLSYQGQDWAWLILPDSTERLMIFVSLATTFYGLILPHSVYK